MSLILGYVAAFAEVAFLRGGFAFGQTVAEVGTLSLDLALGSHAKTLLRAAVRLHLVFSHGSAGVYVYEM